MAFSKDSFATMLLSIALTPNREEYARPYSAAEFDDLMARLAPCGVAGPGALTGMDIAGLMQRFRLTEEEAYRLVTLLGRSVQMNYALESFLMRGVSITTRYDAVYPGRLLSRMGARAPLFFYHSGALELLDRPAIALMGISGVRTDEAARRSIVSLIARAVESGFVIVTGGERGVSRVAAEAADQLGGALIDVVPGALYEHIEAPHTSTRIRDGRALAISLEHPEALDTISHCIARNRVIFSLATAAFVYNTDNRRGEADAIASGYCDYLYAWDGRKENQALIARGAAPFSDAQSFDFARAERLWHESRAVQTSLFDFM